MDERQILELLAEVNAIITGSHLVYTSGKHGTAYVNKDAIYPHTHVTSHLCDTIAGHFVKRGIEVVVAPAVGGVILSQWIAFHLQRRNTTHEVDEVMGIYAEKEDDGFAFHRGYDKLVTGKKVLVVEDVLTTGGSVKKVVEAVRAIGGKVIGVGAICNRGGVTAQDIGDVPELFSLVNIELKTWDEVDCPLCAQGVSINTEVGKGKDYLARKAG